jgi:DNA-binding NarL/FixJ family response regulator
MKILVLTGGGWANLQVASVLAGAHGFLYKPFTSSDLFRAIRLVHEGKLFFDAAALADALSPAAVPQTPSPALTEDERQFLGLVRTCRSTAEIAAALNVSLKAVYQRRFRLKRKLGLRSSKDLDGFAEKVAGPPVT